MLQRGTSRSIVLVIAALLLCGTARATEPIAPVENEPPPAGEPTEPARRRIPIVVDPALSIDQLIDRATRAFAEQNFEAAVVYLSAAYERKPLPPILFNIAQAHRKAGHTREALEIYQHFLLDNPKSPLAPEAAAHASAMQAKLEAERATSEKAAAEERSRQRTEEAERLAKEHESERLQAEAALRKEIARKEQPLYKRKLFWGLLAGVVGAGAITAVALGLAFRTPAEAVGDLSTQVVRF